MSNSNKRNPPELYTFTQIIDADHFTIQRTATTIRRLIATIRSDLTETPTLSNEKISAHLQILTSHLLTASWRLIRHDLSEDLVMRPAFIEILGIEKGTQMAEHDRSDHAKGRIALLEIIARVRTLQQQLSAPTSTLTSMTPATALLALCDTISITFDALASHMAIESGEFLPYLETQIGASTSQRLGREYLATLCLTPFLKLPGGSWTRAETREKGSDGAGSECETASDEGRNDHHGFERLFADEVEYITTDMALLKSMYERIVPRMKEDETVRNYIDAETQREIERLQMDKWRLDGHTENNVSNRRNDTDSALRQITKVGKL